MPCVDGVKCAVSHSCLCTLGHDAMTPRLRLGEAYVTGRAVRRLTISSGIRVAIPTPKAASQSAQDKVLKAKTCARGGTVVTNTSPARAETRTHRPTLGKPLKRRDRPARGEREARIRAPFAPIRVMNVMARAASGAIPWAVAHK